MSHDEIGQLADTFNAVIKINQRLATEADYLAAAKSLGPDALMRTLQEGPLSEDPALQTGLKNGLHERIMNQAKGWPFPKKTAKWKEYRRKTQ